MKLEVPQQWFKEETGVQPETGIRFFEKHLFMRFSFNC